MGYPKKIEMDCVSCKINGFLRAQDMIKLAVVFELELKIRDIASIVCAACCLYAEREK